MQADQCVELLKEVLGEDLLGVYLYGSSVVGGLQKYSDIDLFAVSARATTSGEKEKLAKALLSISGIYMKSEKNPVELTLVVQSDINPWKLPPTFDFQYGDWMRKDFESGNFEPWETKEMYDLAIIITQIHLGSKTLFGPDPAELLPEIPYKDFVHASVRELDNLVGDLEWDTRNVILTLARVWSTLETDMIRSKRDAADWAAERLSPKLKPVMERARRIAIGEAEEDWSDLKEVIRPAAEFMLEKIKETAEENMKKVSSTRIGLDF